MKNLGAKKINDLQDSSSPSVPQNDYFGDFFNNLIVLDLPDRLWTLMEIGVGGYILGRTAEKIRGAE